MPGVPAPTQLFRKSTKFSPPRGKDHGKANDLRLASQNLRDRVRSVLLRIVGNDGRAVLPALQGRGDVTQAQVFFEFGADKSDVHTSTSARERSAKKIRGSDVAF